MPKFKIKLCDGTDAPWTEDEKPVRFNTRAEAEKAIDDFIADTVQAVKDGHMDSPESRDLYEVAEVEEFATAHGALDAVLFEVRELFSCEILPSDCDLAGMMPELETAAEKFTPVFTPAEEVILREAALFSLNANLDELGEKLDLADAVLVALREKLHTHLNPK
jgi:hypothetical protein